MDRDQIKDMIIEILTEADYDLAKSLTPELSEDPEAAEEEMDVLIYIAETHIHK